VGRRKYISKSVRAGPQVRLGFLGNMRRVIVEDQTDGAFRWIVAVQIPKQGNELDAAMAMLDARRDMTVV
jgi:hypothetical protein